MADQQFTHVCTSCHTPTLRLKVQNSFAKRTFYFLLVAASCFFFPLGPLVACAAIFFMARRDGRTCPACRGPSLVPVGSPAGEAIMKNQGWTPT